MRLPMTFPFVRTAALCAAAALAACAPVAAPPDVAAYDALGLAPAGLDAPAGSAARRLLPNATSLPGENYVLTLPSGGFGGGSTAEILRRAGALPAPFEFAIARDFAPVPGTGGAYSYVFATPQEGVTCVLAVGSDIGGRAALMRNCVEGDVAAALAPLAPPRF